MRNSSRQAAFGSRIRQLRLKQGLSLRALATRTGFSPSFISQVEAELASPSIASLEKIVQQLGVTLGQFFTALENAPRTVVRHNERTIYESAWSKSVLTVLTDTTPSRQLSAFEVTVSPGGKSGSWSATNRQDMLIWLLTGTLNLTGDVEAVMLEAGDTAYLAAGTGFAYENTSTEDATMLLIVATNGHAVMGELFANGSIPTA